jgi:hypothetical protein
MTRKDAGLFAAKMNEKQCRNFSDAELRRVFAGCASPVTCIRHVKKLVEHDAIVILLGVTVLNDCSIFAE